MARTEHPRALTRSIAEFLKSELAADGAQANPG